MEQQSMIDQANATRQKLYSVNELVRQLDEISDSEFEDVQRVLRTISEFPVDPGSLSKYLIWNTQHYTRNLIHKNNLYALMALCWEPGQSSSIHNHHGQNCWMAVPVGRLLVQNYRLLFQKIADGECGLETALTVEMNANQPVAVDPKNPVHRVYNPAELGQRAVSLHVYSKPFEQCVVYSQEKGTCGVIDLQYTTEYGSATSVNCDADRS
jgi:cysteine dioxygenase